MASGKKTVVRRVKASSDNASASPQRRKASADKSASVVKPIQPTRKKQAAEVAKEAGVKRLLLNHVSARFLSKDISQMRRDASSVFENVHVVKDLEEVEL